MTIVSPNLLSDAALLAETARAVGVERRSTSDLLALLAELDTRRLYLGQGYPSLFAYCTQALHLSEPSAYTRITAARAARRFPVILTLLTAGDVTLTTVTLLAAHLTDENYDALLAAARHRSKRDIERLVASIDPQPDVATSLRRLPAARSITSSVQVVTEVEPQALETGARLLETASRLPGTGAQLPESGAQLLQAWIPPPSSPSADSSATYVAPSVVGMSRAVVSPISADRYLLKVTLSAEAHATLDRLRALLRHAIPNGDPSAIVDRALTALLEQVEKSRHAATRRPSTRLRPSRTVRHVPSAVKRAVWARDRGQCAFVGTDGRCAETGFLEYHHVMPFAAGGPATVENLQLRCRAHNAHEADRFFGPGASRRRQQPRKEQTLSGQSSRLQKEC
jgi:5-methylcytosine-specific restriction endonuclease McrA